ncbi:MAG: PhoD-like phosphatase [Herbaspirillum sp.]|nr:PhoD-like phosphatase [Herbaspirillum sp.]
MDRRDFLKGSSAVGAAGLTISTVAHAAPATATAHWGAGQLEHMLPTVNDTSMLIKVSLKNPLPQPPVLVVDRKRFTGRRTDSAGRMWAFYAEGLEPNAEYTLNLIDAHGNAMCDSWPLKTFPARNATPKTFRALMYTCAGGSDATGVFLPMTTRIRLLERGLSFKPDAMIANGDHIYLDQRAKKSPRLGVAPEEIASSGRFDRTQAIYGTQNEEVLKRAAGPQIVPLYGTRCRSVPVFFITDDHDYYDNDEADDKLVTFPVDTFMLNAGRTTQWMYYPEHLPDKTRPTGITGASAADRFKNLSECYGTLRYGKIAEMLMYDCRRGLTLTGPTATFVQKEAEGWLTDRMKNSDAAHVVNVPSVPIGWSAGKYGEWYRDMEGDGKLTLTKPKAFWQTGWRLQHDRLMVAASSMNERIPMFISGDLHATGYGIMTRTGEHDLAKNPVHSVITGPLGTDTIMWVSASRGMRPQIPDGLDFNEVLKAEEKHGFIIADYDNEGVVIRHFQWDRDKHSVADIDSLEPYKVTVLKRPG